MKTFFFLSILFFFATCETYDNAIIYHRNFVSGSNPLLKFDGYYSDSIALNSDTGNKKEIGVKPVFFYANGSAFSTNNYAAASQIENMVKAKELAGSWGNYLITGDTIQLEKFQLIENNYELILLKGILSSEKIHWIFRKEHTEVFKPIDYSIYFKPFSAKPDSTQNFTRTKKKYNKIPLE